MDNKAGSFKGAVYGDIIGAPYMVENTYNRYFDLGEERRAYSHGRVRVFFPEVTEVSHAASAVTTWLNGHRDRPTIESLQECLRKEYERHPRGGWTEATRLYLSSPAAQPSTTSDWAAVARVLPIGELIRDDLFLALELTEACVKATCDNAEALQMARAVTHCIHSTLGGSTAPELYTMLEQQYGLDLTKPEDDLRAELRGERKIPLEMLGTPIEGAYRYVPDESGNGPDSRAVTEAALRAVLRSDSWEDAVRRAVSYGGPSNAVAAIAGGVAQALYGEITPTIIGKLIHHVPTYMQSQIESLERRGIKVESVSTPYASIEHDALPIISLGAGRTVYVIPKERDDIRAVVKKSFPRPTIITPEEVEGFIGKKTLQRSGTYAYRVRPEQRILYVQDGERLVTPTEYIAPGMPPLQERRRHLKEFLELRSWCIEKQAELNRLAGNEGAGQIHYEGAYHLWIGSKRIDVMMGDQLAGRVSLDARGLLKVEQGEMRSISADSRFENHREQAWAAREVFSTLDTISPLNRLQSIRDALSFALLDEGNGSENIELDTRYMTEEERLELLPVSNIEHLTPLDRRQSKGKAANREGDSPAVEAPVRGKTQQTSRIYTIGYGRRSSEGFINTLQMSGIDTVVDVRSIPHSSYTPHFNEDAIYDTLTRSGITYLAAGESLGGRTRNSDLYDSSGRVDWEKVMHSQEYLDALDRLESLAQNGHVVAVVCSEGDPLICHRFGTISRTLSEDGFDLKHIMHNGEVVSQEEMECRLVEKYARKSLIAETVNAPYSEQVKEAFRIMNSEVGYKPKPKKQYFRNSFHR